MDDQTEDDLWRQGVDEKLDLLRAGVEMCMEHIEQLAAAIDRLSEQLAPPPSGGGRER